MRIQVFDVEHGGCALVTADTGARVLVDCGHNSSTNWRPSTYLANLGVRHLERLIVTNYDEDHVSDLPNLVRTVGIGSLFRNPTVSGAQLRSLKNIGGIGQGIEMLVGMTSRYVHPVNGQATDFGALSFQYFWNAYPSDFEDENNLSLVAILRCHGITIAFPGDMEVAGWRALLRYPTFVTAMQAVNVLVASHHGRENGCCDELFSSGWRPQITIISDSGVEYATQETVAWYRARTTGITYNSEPRHVFTTRRDGRILLEATPQGATILGGVS